MKFVFRTFNVSLSESNHCDTFLISSVDLQFVSFDLGFDVAETNLYPLEIEFTEI